MSSELPSTNRDYTKTDRYKRAKEAEKKNPFFKFYKASPESYPLTAGCCTVRAICTAEGVMFKEVERKLIDNLAEIGYGYYAYNEMDYLSKHYPKQSFKAVKGQKRMNGRMFAETHPRGRYVLNMAGHLTACVDGVILDTFDCTRHCVYSCWEVSKQ